MPTPAILQATDVFLSALVARTQTHHALEALVAQPFADPLHWTLVAAADQARDAQRQCRLAGEEVGRVLECEVERVVDKRLRETDELGKATSRPRSTSQVVSILHDRIKTCQAAVHELAERFDTLENSVEMDREDREMAQSMDMWSGKTRKRKRPDIDKTDVPASRHAIQQEMDRHTAEIGVLSSHYQDLKTTVAAYTKTAESIRIAVDAVPGLVHQVRSVDALRHQYAELSARVGAGDSAAQGVSHPGSPNAQSSAHPTGIDAPPAPPAILQAIEKIEAAQAKWAAERLVLLQAIESRDRLLREQEARYAEEEAKRGVYYAKVDDMLNARKNDMTSSESVRIQELSSLVKSLQAEMQKDKDEKIAREIATMAFCLENAKQGVQAQVHQALKQEFGGGLERKGRSEPMSRGSTSGSPGFAQILSQPQPQPQPQIQGYFSPQPAQTQTRPLQAQTLQIQPQPHPHPPQPSLYQYQSIEYPGPTHPHTQTQPGQPGQPGQSGYATPPLTGMMFSSTSEMLKRRGDRAGSR